MPFADVAEFRAALLIEPWSTEFVSTVTEKLEGYQAEMGYGNLVTMGQFGTLGHEQVIQSMQMFAEEVMPKLRHIGTSAAAAAE